MIDLIRKVSYNSAIRSFVRRVGLHSTAQQLYCKLLSRDSGQYKFHIDGMCAVFSTPSLDRYRMTEIVALTESAQIHRILSTLRPGDVFYDVGSDCGLYAIPAALKGCTVVAFEPFPASCRLLRENLKRNHLDSVKVVTAALSDSSGECFLESDTQDGFHSPRLVGNTDAVGKGARVVLAAADQLIAEGEFPEPTVVKIDVEGHEEKVIRGMKKALSNDRCRAVMCEVHRWLGVSPESVESLFRSLGFDRFEAAQRGTDYELLAFKN
jgi:FkbM family methyltransferase